MNSRICFALCILALCVSTTRGDDNTWSSSAKKTSLEVFHRLHKSSEVRVASAQSAVDDSSSDHFPTQYMDPEELDDLQGELVEQPVVSADTADSGPLSYENSYTDAPNQVVVEPACGCGESAIQQSWPDDVGCCVPSTPVACQRARRHGGCHYGRRSACCGHGGGGCGRSCLCGCGSGCDDGGCDESICCNSGCHHGLLQAAGCHGCHHCCRQSCGSDCEYVSHGCCGRGSMHLLGHARCCR